MNGLRLSLGTFTIIPVRPPSRLDRSTARSAMLLAPAVGIALGLAGALVLWAVRSLSPTAFGNLLGAALAIAALAYLTRALHFDGLADTADALGSGRTGSAALEIARRSDIGPFGVIAIVLVLLIDTAALGAAAAAHHGTVAVVVAVATGRLAATWSCVRGIPAARADGLGATVSGTVPRLAAIAWTLALLGVAVGLAALDDDVSARSLVAAPLAVVVGLVVTALILRRTTRRWGGITGDVIGMCVEASTTAALVVMALT